MVEPILDAPASVRPQNCRLHTYSHNDMFLLSMQLLATGLVKALLVGGGIGVCITFVQNGMPPLEVLAPWLLEMFITIAGGGGLFLLLIAFFVRRNVFSMRVYNTPYVVGYTQDVLYGECAYTVSYERWEYFLSFKETKKYFVLTNGGARFVLPKGIWSPAECDEIRSLLKEKTGKPYEQKNHA